MLALQLGLVAIIGAAIGVLLLTFYNIHQLNKEADRRHKEEINQKQIKREIISCIKLIALFYMTGIATEA